VNVPLNSRPRRNNLLESVASASICLQRPPKSATTVTSSEANLTRANQSRTHTTTKKRSCSGPYVREIVQSGHAKMRKSVRRRSPEISGSVMTLAEEGPKPPRNCRTGRRYLNANRHRYLIKCRQKDKYPQELYIFANSIPSESDGACIADWFFGVDAHRSVSVYPYGRSQERCYCESVILREVAEWTLFTC
jgi:hypothetical protein